MTISAGILLYRKKGKSIEFLLVHPGGPFFKNKDKGWWTIPKGEPEEDEKLQDTATRELKEETGIEVHDNLIPLGQIKQKGGKTVHAWAAGGDWNPESGLPADTFEMEWPPRSGKKQSFPEVDQARWFTPEAPKEYINAAQTELIERLINTLKGD
ncbi:NUDIX domain-containing protein [Roseivirga sp. BDSF3-8]|uniref:NUDIX hydrolase n=1 Tax=Roseivirga sp. BDSF3-8 TaxID=3241598 RepID=UPI003531B41B